MKAIPNLITCGRILLSAALLFVPVFSLPFYIIYIAAGLTDMIDGPVARRTGAVSEFGSRLDTVADLVFVAVCLVRLLPRLDVPAWLWGWIGVIALIKATNLVSGFVMRKQFIALHTAMNKITGVLLFILPLTPPVLALTCSAPVVCAAATFAAVQEGHFIRTGKTEQEGKEPAKDE